MQTSNVVSPSTAPVKGSPQQTIRFTQQLFTGITPDALPDSILPFYPDQNCIQWLGFGHMVGIKPGLSAWQARNQARNINEQWFQSKWFWSRCGDTWITIQRTTILNCIDFPPPISTNHFATVPLECIASDKISEACFFFWCDRIQLIQCRKHTHSSLMM